MKQSSAGSPVRGAAPAPRFILESRVPARGRRSGGPGVVRGGPRRAPRPLPRPGEYAPARFRFRGNIRKAPGALPGEPRRLRPGAAPLDYAAASGSGHEAAPAALHRPAVFDHAVGRRPARLRIRAASPPAPSPSMAGRPPRPARPPRRMPCRVGRATRTFANRLTPIAPRPASRRSGSPGRSAKRLTGP